MSDVRKEYMVTLYEPRYEDLWFRQKLMSDVETMSYNHAWGGTIPFPVERWREWYEHWVLENEEKRFYRYLKDDGNHFVGEISYHFDDERSIYIANVIVYAPYRKKGYGRQGLELLCREAKRNGIKVLYDDIAIDNPSVSLFIKVGFTEEYQTDELIMLKKIL